MVSKKNYFARRIQYLFLIITMIIFSLIQGISAIDYYQLFDLRRDASDKEIKKAFRRLSLKYHPDRNRGDEMAAEMNIQINKAYEVLMDPEKRQIYDVYGEEGLNNEQNMQQNRMPKGPNARLDLNVDLDEIYNGNTKEMSITKNTTCKKCRGTGGKLGKTKKCPKCNGRGAVIEEVNTGMGFSMRMQNECNRCGGKGITFSETCDVCRGRKVVKEDKKLRVEIEKGMPEGHQILFHGESEAHPDHAPGDLILVVRTNKHNFFDSRTGDDLYANMELNLKEALLGYTKSFRHMDGRKVEVKDDKPTQPFKIRELRGEGMPVFRYPSSKGKLHLTMKVRLPEKLTEAEKKLVEDLF